MNRMLFLAAMICVLLFNSQPLAQSQDPPKFEIAGEFTTLNREDFSGTRSEPGVGGRFTYNLNKNFALETAGYFFPRRCFGCLNNGRVLEGVGGLKAGKRFKTWGVFAKARPGVVSFSKGEFNIVQTGPIGPFPFEIQVRRLTSFATDLGGVLEFYPSRPFVTRFDAGDTIIHFTRRTNNELRYDPLTNGISLVPFTRPARTTHNFQFTAGVGFRF